MSGAKLETVLQVNVRLSEGGAAGVARSLAGGLAARGIQSPIAYGYSKGGRASPAEADYDTVRVTPGPVAAANRLMFPLVGDETRIRGPRSWKQYEQAVAAADVVHFHAVHSHMARVSELARVCLEQEKPVVWTMHDHWLMTGRCAQPGTCRAYLDGCPKCPDLGAYPSARFDRASRHWPTRRQVVHDLDQSGRFALVSCAEWLAVVAREAQLPEVVTVTNSVDASFWESVSATRSGPRGDRTRVLFVCRDLRDPVKVSWPLLLGISRLPNVDLTIVGDNASDNIPALAEHFAATASRPELARLMRSHDVLVFSSTVDYYPLTFVEALVAGMHVLAIDSAAAREFAQFSEVMVLASHEQMLAKLAAMGSPSEIRSGRVERIDVNLETFRPERMVEQYLDIYHGLLSAP